LADEKIIIQVDVKGNAARDLKKIESGFKSWSTAADKASKKSTKSIKKAESSFKSWSKSVDKASKKSSSAISKSSKKIKKDLGGVNKGLKKSGKAAKKTGDDFKDAGKAAGSAFDVFKGTLASAGVVGAFNLASDAARSFFGLLSEGVTLAEDEQNAVTALNSALIRNGEFSKEASDDLASFADSLERTTTVGADVIISQLALSQAFGASAEQSKIATSAALELAAAADISLTEATRRVGRAMSGSTADISKFAPEILKLTKAELAAGKAADLLVKALGGTAAAKLNTFAGASEQLKSAIEGVQTELGKVVTENPALAALMKQLTNEFNNLADAVTENIDEIKAFSVDALLGFADASIVVVDVISSMVEGFDNINIAVKGARSAFSFIFQPIGELTTKYKENKAAHDADLDAAIAGAESRKRAFAGIATAAENLRARLKESSDVSVEDQKAFNEQMEEQSKDSAIKQAEFKREQDAIAAQEKETKRQSDLERDIADLEARNAALSSIDAKKNADEIAENEKLIQTKLSMEESHSTRILKLKAKQAEKEREIERSKLQTAADGLGNLTSLMRTGNKDLFEIGKVSAIASATINASVAITKALREGGPFLGPFLAATIGIKTGVEIANIQATKLAGGITEVPSGFDENRSGGGFPALLSSGERVISAEQNSDLKDFIGGDGAITPLLQEISTKLDRQIVSVEIGGEQIVKAVNSGIEGGTPLTVEPV